MLIVSLSVVSLNARGLRQNCKRKALFLFAKKFKSDFCFFQESHSLTADINFWKSQWGNDAWYSHGSERSAGVTTFKNTFGGKVLHSDCDSLGHYVCLVIECNNVLFILVNLYGYNTKPENDRLLDSLDTKLTIWLFKYPNSTLLIGGDFNIALNTEVDRWPPAQSSVATLRIKTLMEKYNLIDIWRKKYPDNRSFTWSNRSGSRQSRIDFWLLSDNIAEDGVTVNILTTPLTDHRAIYINIQLFTYDNLPCRSSYWKLNSSLLEHKMVKTEIRKLIDHFWDKAIKEESYNLNWELFKFEAGKFLRQYGAKVAKARTAEEDKLITEISSIFQQHPDVVSEEDKLKIRNLQNKLDDLYRYKAEGAFVRSRKKWLEEGEQNSAYFFRLEKYRSKMNNIHQLNINGTVTNDAKIISTFCCNFYSNLYDTNYNAEYAKQLFDSVNNIRKIELSDCRYCDSPLTVEEVVKSITLLKNNKSPGTDGMVAEFYKAFSDQLAPFLLQVFMESIKNGALPPSLTQGLITLIPKPNKDVLFIDNWRPICLLNNDYKIMALVLAGRIKDVLDDIIDETQSGFMKDRHISNNIRLVLDLLDYSDLILDDSFILFLDFYKAFDTIEHDFIFLSLEHFGFGKFFCDCIKTLYTNGNSSIRMKHGTTSRFNLKRGIRQGCPISPYLFLLCTQILALHIKNSNIQGISIAGRDIIISQLADDTTVFLKNSDQVPVALQIIENFSKASGLTLNINKCQLFPIKECNLQCISNINVQKEVTYLGLIICKDQNARTLLNFSPIVKKAQTKFNQWLQRDLTVKGRVLLSKAEGLSRLTYAALSLYVDNKTCGNIDRILFNFIWKNRTHYIRKSVVMNTYDNGGLNFLDFTTLNNTFKINWAKHFLKNPVSLWNFIPHYIFSRFGGLNFLLGCNYNPGKLPVKLSLFHKQLLLAWSLIYKHNFSPHTYLIWNNKDILYKNKSLFLANWVEKQVLLVNQLFDNHGQLLSYSEFLNTFQFLVTPKEYAIVFGAIPNGVIMLFKNSNISSPVPVSLPNPLLSPVGKTCFTHTLRNANKNIRALFQKESVSVPYVVSYWNRFVVDIIWKKVWRIPNQYLLTNKVKEVSFKIIHKYYPANHYMIKFKRDIDANCSFCGDQPETVLHLFWTCSYPSIFWKDLSRYVINHLHKDFVLKWENIVFCFFRKQTKENQYFIINLLIILAKFFIHKCKYSKQIPSFAHFYEDVVSYMKLLYRSKNRKAMKTVNMCTILKIFGCT